MIIATDLVNYYLNYVDKGFGQTRELRNAAEVYKVS